MALTSEALIRKMLDLFGARKTYLLTGMTTTTAETIVAVPDADHHLDAVPDAQLRPVVAPDAQVHPIGVPCAQIHLSIDSADEVDPDLNLVQVCGGSLHQETMNEAAGNSFVIDQSKLIPHLERAGLVPVVDSFGAEYTFALAHRVFDELPNGPGNNIVVEHGMFTRKAPWPPPSSTSLATKTSSCYKHLVKPVGDLDLGTGTTPPPCPTSTVYGFIQDSVSDPAYADATSTTVASVPSDGDFDTTTGFTFGKSVPGCTTAASLKIHCIAKSTSCYHSTALRPGASAPRPCAVLLLQSCQNKELDLSYYGCTDADLREFCLGVWRIDVWSIASFPASAPAVGIGTGPCIGSATACEGAPTKCSMEFLNSVPALVYKATIEDFIFDPGITVEVSSTSSAVPIDNSSGMSTKCSMNGVVQLHVFKSMENKCRKTPWPPPPQKLTNQKASLKLIAVLFHWTLKYFCETWDFWKYMAMLWSTSHGSQVCCCITSRAIDGALIPIISGHHDSYISTGSETISVWFGDQEPSKGNQLGIYRRSKLIMCSAFDVLSELLLPFVPVLSDVLVEGTPPSISWYCIDLEQWCVEEINALTVGAQGIAAEVSLRQFSMSSHVGLVFSLVISYSTLHDMRGLLVQLPETASDTSGWTNDANTSLLHECKTELAKLWPRPCLFFICSSGVILVIMPCDLLFHDACQTTGKSGNFKQFDILMLCFAVSTRDTHHMLEFVKEVYYRGNNRNAYAPESQKQCYIDRVTHTVRTIAAIRSRVQKSVLSGEKLESTVHMHGFSSDSGQACLKIVSRKESKGKMIVTMEQDDDAAVLGFFIGLGASRISSGGECHDMSRYSGQAGTGWKQTGLGQAGSSPTSTQASTKAGAQATESASNKIEEQRRLLPLGFGHLLPLPPILNLL